MEDRSRPIALVGLMGSGKSTVGEALGRRLGGPVADIDALVEAAAGAEVTDVFEIEGEAGFRQRETEALVEALERDLAVLSTGGGIVIDEGNRTLLRERCRVVWLQVTPAEAARRVRQDAALRPLLAGAAIEERLERLLGERMPFYEKVAHLRVATDGRSADQVADEILAATAQQRSPAAGAGS